jgi:hypothetical protein
VFSSVLLGKFYDSTPRQTTVASFYSLPKPFFIIILLLGAMYINRKSYKLQKLGKCERRNPHIFLNTKRETGLLETMFSFSSSAVDKGYESALNQAMAASFRILRISLLIVPLCGNT